MLTVIDFKQIIYKLFTNYLQIVKANKNKKFTIFTTSTSVVTIYKAKFNKSVILFNNHLYGILNKINNRFSIEVIRK